MYHMRTVTVSLNAAKIVGCCKTSGVIVTMAKIVKKCLAKNPSNMIAISLKAFMLAPCKTYLIPLLMIAHSSINAAISLPSPKVHYLNDADQEYNRADIKPAPVQRQRYASFRRGCLKHQPSYNGMIFFIAHTAAALTRPELELAAGFHSLDAAFVEALAGRSLA